MVAVVQREWAGKNPRAMFRDPITVEDVLEQPHDRLPHAHPEVLPRHRRRRRADPDRAPTARRTSRPSRSTSSAPARASESPMVSQMEDFTSSRAFRVAGTTAFAGGGHLARRRGPPHDLRRLRAPAALRARGPRLRRPRRGGGLHRRAQHGARRQAAAQHQRRRPFATPTPACTACSRSRRACGRCAAPRRRRCPVRRSRSRTASAGCSRRAARSS